MNVNINISTCVHPILHVKLFFVDNLVWHEMNRNLVRNLVSNTQARCRRELPREKFSVLSTVIWKVSIHLFREVDFDGGKNDLFPGETILRSKF